MACLLPTIKLTGKKLQSGNIYPNLWMDDHPLTKSLPVTLIMMNMQQNHSPLQQMLTNVNISCIIHLDLQGFDQNYFAAHLALAVLLWIFEHESPPFWELAL